MESKKNTGLIVLVVIMTLVIVGLAGFIVYDKVLREDTKVEEKTSSSTKEKANEEINNQTKNNIIQFLVSDIGHVIIDTDGSAYYKPAILGNLVNTSYNLNFDDTSDLGNLSTYKINDIDSFEGYKLDLQNIVSAYEIYFGNGNPSDSILFVNSDGHVSIMNVTLGYPDTKAKLTLEKNIEGYENIVSVVKNDSNNASGAILIDKDNNKYEYFGTN